MFQICRIKDTDTYSLRIEILRNGIAENYRFKSDTHPDTFHLGAFYDEECIGIVSFLPNEHPDFQKKNSYQLRGMAVKDNFQKQGVGGLLLQKALEILKEKKAKMLWCNARIIAVDFYKKMAFKTKGKLFNIPRIGGHYMMYRLL